MVAIMLTSTKIKTETIVILRRLQFADEESRPGRRGENQFAAADADPARRGIAARTVVP